MARNTKRGKCELCGEVANVGTNHGSATCPKCTHVQAALANRLQAVAKAARAMGKAEDLIKALIPDGGSLAVQVTATLLQEISGIVGYDGDDPAELVEAVRKRALTCASCDHEDDLQRIADVIGYAGVRGDGLVEAVRALIVTPGTAPDCADCTAMRDDLARACGLDLDYSHGWDFVAAAAIQTIAELTNRRDDLMDMLKKECRESSALRNEIARMNGQTHIESEQVTDLRDDFEHALQRIETASANLRLAEQSRDEWESRSRLAEAHVETLEAELRKREVAPAVPSLGYCCSDSDLLDIALRALRGEGPDADQLATIIDAARRAA